MESKLSAFLVFVFSLSHFISVYPTQLRLGISLDHSNSGSRSNFHHTNCTGDPSDEEALVGKWKFGILLPCLCRDEKHLHPLRIFKTNGLSVDYS